MNDTSDKTSKKSGGRPGPAQKAGEILRERVAEPARRAGEAMRASGQTWAEGGSRISLTLIDQAERNLQEAFAAMRQAAKAKDLSEVMTLQAEFLRRQGARAVEQAREVGELIVEIGRQAATPLDAGKAPTETTARAESASTKATRSRRGGEGAGES